MGIDVDFSNAYAKASIAAGLALPKSGKVFITMIDKFKEEIVPVAKQLKVGQTRVTPQSRTAQQRLPPLS